MKLNELIEKFQKLNKETEDAKFKKSIKQLINLLDQIENKGTTNEKLDEIQISISPYLENIQSQKELKLGLKKLRNMLMSDFGFVPPNYYLALGTGLGIALGTALGISIGVTFDNGIVYGQMTGSGIGLIGGLLVGMFLDKEKESENRVLKDL